MDSKDVFVVGADGLIFHYDGIKWTRQRSNTRNWLRRIWGVDNTVFAIGDYGTILRYDGKKWKNTKGVTRFQLLGIWGNRKDNIYVVGSNLKGRY